MMEYVPKRWWNKITELIEKYSKEIDDCENEEELLTALEPLSKEFLCSDDILLFWYPKEFTEEFKDLPNLVILDAPNAANRFEKENHALLFELSKKLFNNDSEENLMWKFMQYKCFRDLNPLSKFDVMAMSKILLDDVFLK